MNDDQIDQVTRAYEAIGGRRPSIDVRSPLVDLSDILGHAFKVRRGVVQAIQARPGLPAGTLDTVQISILFPDGDTRHWEIETETAPADIADTIEARLWPEGAPADVDALERAMSEHNRWDIRFQGQGHWWAHREYDEVGAGKGTTLLAAVLDANANAKGAP